MRYLPVFFALLLCLSFIACKPSLGLIKAYEEVSKLNKGVLMVQLPAPDPDWEVMRKYGKLKKADRQEQRYIGDIKAIMAAFAENYSFSETAFFYQDPKRTEEHNEPWFVVIDHKLTELGEMHEFMPHMYVANFQTMIDNGGESEQEQLALIVRNFRMIDLQPPFPAVNESNGGHSLSTYRWAIRNFDRRLHKLLKKKLTDKRIPDQVKED